MAAVWNHNIQYYPLILGLVGEKPRSTALDVGCGDGMLARAMADAVPHVVGVGSSRDRVEFCRAEYARVAGLEFECADVLRADLGEFDVVTCSATLHRHGAPTADPRETYSDIRSLAQRLLPGARFRRHRYWRYSLIWERPLVE